MIKFFSTAIALMMMLAAPALAAGYGSPGNFEAFRSNMPVEGGASIYAVQFNKNGLNYLVNTDVMQDNVYTGAANVFVVDRGIVDTADPAAVVAYIEQQFTGRPVTAVMHSAVEGDLTVMVNGVPTIIPQRGREYW